jgi:hypothetical protein
MYAFSCSLQHRPSDGAHRLRRTTSSMSILIVLLIHVLNFKQVYLIGCPT